MRWLPIVATLAVQAVPAPVDAKARTSVRCTGETFSELAEQAYGDAQLGEVVAIFNRRRGEERCKAGSFVRFPFTIRHELRLGQPVQAVADRFARAPGAEAVIREKNGIPEGVEPNPGTVLEVPAELALEVGTRPAVELGQIPGLPDLGLIKRYNGVSPKKRLPPGGTIYIPLFLELKEALPSAPPPPKETVEAPPPAEETGPEALPEPVAVRAAAVREAFRHDVHRALMGDLSCGLCHLEDPRTDYGYRPIPMALCGTCHQQVAVETSGARAYQLPLAFSHDLHLDPERKVVEEGYTLTCDRCHSLAEDGEARARPGHAECAKCHNPSEVQPAVSGDCGGCHGQAEALDRLGMALALLDEHFRASPRGTDVRFAHASHEAALSQEGDGDAPCARCHRDAASTDDLTVIEPQRMADCMVCHRGLERALAGEAVSLDRCRTCHVAARPEAAPAFGSVIDKPISHTATFRIRHRRQAEADDNLCAACHRELAGGPGDRCDRCHSQMRPRDHSVRWREEPHGRAAARNPDRCSTCHQRDRCASCHSVAPRDHYPRLTFRLRHGISARTSTRRCLTCHLPQIDCARCHDVTSF